MKIKIIVTIDHCSGVFFKSPSRHNSDQATETTQGTNNQRNAIVEISRETTVVVHREGKEPKSGRSTSSKKVNKDAWLVAVQIQVV